MSINQRRMATTTSDTWKITQGDIVIFGVDRSSWKSRLVGSLTDSDWTHATIITVEDVEPPPPELDDNPDRRPWLAPKRVLLFEAVSKADSPMFDFMTRTRRCGVRLVDARARLRQVARSGRQMKVCRVVGPDAAERLEGALATVKKVYVEKPYERSFRRLNVAISAVSERMQDGDELEGSGAFCSELVARVLLEAGFIPGDMYPAYFRPGDFVDKKSGGTGIMADFVAGRGVGRYTKPQSLGFSGDS